MIRSVLVVGSAVGVLAVGGITAAAGNAHPSALTHLAKNGSPAGEERGGALTTLSQGVRVTATEAEDATEAERQTPTKAQSARQDEDTAEKDDAAEQASAEAPPAAPSSGEQERVGGKGGGGGD